ncbi:MAG: glycosyl hydrolase [Bacteroidota bacterium]
MKSMLLILTMGLSTQLFSQLVIYSDGAQSGTSATCSVSTIYKTAGIPGGMNDAVSSIQLQQGYMATLAENEDGSGAAYTFIAAISNVSVNLNALLNNKVSFIRVLPLRNTLKKGAGLQNNTHIDQLDVSWFYDWGPNDVSLPNREYALMAWGKQAASNPANITTYINKPDVTHLLSFNEPDNTDQSNIPVDTAVKYHKNLAETGLRLGSPAPTESQAFVWLTNFMAGTRQAQIKVDYMAVHWYDWGSYLSTLNTAPSPNDVFNRFKSYINYVYAVYGKPIWITEFNANRNTTSATHEAFIALALPWLESQPFVERYAYFFPPSLPPVDGSGTITPIGIAYRDFAASTPAIAKNYDNTELITEDVNTLFEAESATLYGSTITSCATASGGQMAGAVTGNNRISFHEINVQSGGNYKVEISYFSTVARTLAMRINHGIAQTISIPASGSLWCYQGGSPGVYEIPVSLLAGNNSIEFTLSPIIDFARVKSAGALPVSLLNFSGLVYNKSIELNWSTAQEQNGRHFEILKSTDGNHFVTIGKLHAIGNSNTVSGYHFTDNSPVTGMNFYKLKAVDNDGSFTYSKTVSLKYDGKAGGLSLVSSTSNNIRISAYSGINEKASIILFSIDGKQLYKQSVDLSSGLNFIDIPNSMSKTNVGVITLYTSKTVNSIKIKR